MVHQQSNYTEPIDVSSPEWEHLSPYYSHQVVDRKRLSVSHLYQSFKFNANRSWLELIAKVNGAEAEQIGGLALVSRWWERRDEAMRQAIRIMLDDAPTFRRALLDSTPRPLRFDNYHHSIYWGICLCNECLGVGENRYGYYLSSERKRIVSEDNYNSLFVR